MRINDLELAIRSICRGAEMRPALEAVRGSAQLEVDGLAEFRAATDTLARRLGVAAMEHPDDPYRPWA